MSRKRLYKKIRRKGRREADTCENARNKLWCYSKLQYKQESDSQNLFVEYQRGLFGEPIEESSCCANDRQDCSNNLVGFRVLLFFISALIISLFARPGLVYADPFYPSADGAHCDFGYSVSMSIHNLPQSKDVAGGMVFDAGDVDGERGDYPETHMMSDVAELMYPNAGRYRGVADRVAVPPGARVDIGLFVFNYSHHRVQSDGGWLFLSRGDADDWGRIGDLDQYYSKNVGFNLHSRTMRRTGRAARISSLGSYPYYHYPNLPHGETIMNFSVNKALDFDECDVSHHYGSAGNLIADLRCGVRNVSAYRLQNVRYEHYGYSSTQTFDAGQRHEYSYSIDLGTNYDLHTDLGFARVFDPNVQTECVVDGARRDHLGYNPNQWMFILYRDDLGAPNGWWGKQGDFPTYPEGDSMCLTRTAYQLNGEEIILEVDSKLRGQSSISDNDEYEVVEVTSDIGEDISVGLGVVNDEARADDVSVLVNYDENVLEVNEECSGIVVGDTIRFDLGALAHDEKWNCDIGFQVRDGEYAVGKRSEIVINICKQNECIRSNLYVNVRNKAIINISQNVNPLVVETGDTIQFLTEVSNDGYVALENIMLNEDLSSCDNLELLSSVNDLPVGEDINIPRGVYSLRAEYEIGEGFRNCAYCTVIQDAGSGDEVARECSAIYRREVSANVEYGMFDGVTTFDHGIDDVALDFTGDVMFQSLFGSQYSGSREVASTVDRTVGFDGNEADNGHRNIGGRLARTGTNGFWLWGVIISYVFCVLISKRERVLMRCFDKAD